MPAILEIRTRLLTREDYLRLISAESRSTGLRSIYEKEFAPKLAKLAEERPADLSTLLHELDKYHTDMLLKVVNEDPDNRVLVGVDALLRTYSLIPALLAHQKGLKPNTYISVPMIIPSELITQPRSAYSVNPLIVDILKDYISAGKLRPETIARSLDRISTAIRTAKSYHEFLVSSLFYDMILVRLCSFREFREVLLRPLLITAQDLKGVCELASVDLQSALSVLKKTHPCMNTVVSVYEDSVRLVPPFEALDLSITVSTSFIATQILHSGNRSFSLKKYLLYLRQSTLLRTVLLLLEEPTLRSDLRLFIERWIRP